MVLRYMVYQKTTSTEERESGKNLGDQERGIENNRTYYLVENHHSTAKPEPRSRGDPAETHRRTHVFQRQMKLSFKFSVQYGRLYTRLDGVKADMTQTGSPAAQVTFQLHFRQGGSQLHKGANTHPWPWCESSLSLCVLSVLKVLYSPGQPYLQVL